jgi:hypothetical protein
MLDDIAALAALRLVKVYTSRGWSLVSLEHRVVLAEAEDMGIDNTPQVRTIFELTSEHEEKAARLAGHEYHGEFPGWDVVLAYLATLFPAADTTDEQSPAAVLADIVEAMYPGGDPDAQWSPDTLDEIAAILGRAGLVPEDAHPDLVVGAEGGSACVGNEPVVTDAGCEWCGMANRTGKDGLCDQCRASGDEACARGHF